jgi:uncharacterized protein (DUF1810 family)
MSATPYDLERFVAAQRHVYEDVVGELRRGHKTGHWIWFIFPQIAGLGSSPTSRQFAIGSLDEARAYVAHPVLGPRLLECSRLVLAIEGRTAAEIFGSLDAMKVRSSMTLFHRAVPDEPVFPEVLARFYDGAADPATDAILGGD